MEKVIAITLYRRPELTAALFKALALCYGINEYTVLISCDYNPDHGTQCSKVAELARCFAYTGVTKETRVIQHNERQGVDLNKLFVLPLAFELSDFVIFLEDDTPPAPDALRYFEAMNAQYKDDPNVVSISGYNRYLDADEHARVLKDEPYHLDKGTGFCPWGWGMWRDRYEDICGLDGAKYLAATGDQANGLFDHNIARVMSERPGAYTVYPVLPRTNHVGWEDAEHTPSREFLMENEYAPFTAASQPMPNPLDVTWVMK